VESALPLILVFVHPDCGPCTDLLSNAAAWQHQTEGRCRLVFVSQGSQRRNRQKAARLGWAHFLLQEKQEVSDAYRCEATPSAVVIRPGGRIGSPIAVGAERIQALVADTINEPAARLRLTSVEEGDAAPDLVYPDLDGRLVSLAGPRGRWRLLLFWNPSCPFCRQMVDEVNAWNNAWTDPLPGIVVIATGSAEDNRKLNLRAPVLLDPAFSAGNVFGTRSTPSAVLVDENGRIASAVATGRDAIAVLGSSTAAVLEASVR
jgi:peroxiredoxin